MSPDPNAVKPVSEDFWQWSKPYCTKEGKDGKSVMLLNREHWRNTTDIPPGDYCNVHCKPGYLFGNWKGTTHRVENNFTAATEKTIRKRRTVENINRTVPRTRRTTSRVARWHQTDFGRCCSPVKVWVEKCGVQRKQKTTFPLEPEPCKVPGADPNCIFVKVGTGSNTIRYQ